MLRFSSATDFWHSKLTWLGLSGVATAVAGVIQGTTDLVTGVGLVFSALALIFVRDTIAKGNEENAAQTQVGTIAVSEAIQEMIQAIETKNAGYEVVTPVAPPRKKKRPVATESFDA